MFNYVFLIAFCLISAVCAMEEGNVASQDSLKNIYQSRIDELAKKHDVIIYPEDPHNPTTSSEVVDLVLSQHDSTVRLTMTKTTYDQLTTWMQVLERRHHGSQYQYKARRVSVVHVHRPEIKAEGVKEEKEQERACVLPIKKRKVHQ